MRTIKYVRRTALVLRVAKIGEEHYVQKQCSDGTWESVGNAYSHSTSAWAALGKLSTQPVGRYDQ